MNETTFEISNSALTNWDTILQRYDHYKLTIIILKFRGIWYWVFENCPDRRVRHLVRYKNYLHAQRLATKSKIKVNYHGI